MKRILHLVPIKNVILKWFKIDIFRLLRPLTAKQQQKNNIYLFVFKHNSSSKSHIEQISIENILVVTTISGPRNRLPRLLLSGSQSHFATTKRSKLTSFSLFCFYVEKGAKTDSEIRAFTCIPPNTKRIDLCSYLAMMCLAGDLFQLCSSTLTLLSCLSAFEKQQYAWPRQFLQKRLQFAFFILFPRNKNVFIYLIMKYSAFDLFLGRQFQKGRSCPSCKLFYNNNSLKNLPNLFLAT